jgi:hypothetical protein
VLHGPAGSARRAVFLAIDDDGRDMSLAASRGEFLTQSQLILEDCFPGSIDYDGETFPCARSGEESREEWETGGTREQFRVTVRVRLAYLPADGLERETLLDLDGQTMRVVSCLREIGDVAWSVELETE